MGKALIIKGADFSANALLTDIWYNNCESLVGTNLVSTTLVITSPEAVDALGLQGKAVNKIKLRAAAAGTMTIAVVTYSGTRESGNFSYSAVSGSGQSFDVVEGENTIVLATPITLSEGQLIIFTGVKSKMQVNNITGDASEYVNGNGWNYCTSDTWMNAKMKIPVMLGYVDYYRQNV